MSKLTRWKWIGFVVGVLLGWEVNTLLRITLPVLNYALPLLTLVALGMLVLVRAK